MKVIEFIPEHTLVIEAQSGIVDAPDSSFTFSKEGNGTRLDLSVKMEVHRHLSINAIHVAR